MMEKIIFIALKFKYNQMINYKRRDIFMEIPLRSINLELRYGLYFFKITQRPTSERTG